jgi:hypothetical protein
MARRAIYILYRLFNKRRSAFYQYRTALITKYFALVMAVDRALMVDTLPAFEQPSGTAWAARMLAIGSVAGFFVCISFIAILSNELANTSLF